MYRTKYPGAMYLTDTIGACWYKYDGALHQIWQSFLLPKTLTKKDESLNANSSQLSTNQSTNQPIN
jgi:hypothetical protein